MNLISYDSIFTPHPSYEAHITYFQQIAAPVDTENECPIESNIEPDELETIPNYPPPQREEGSDAESDSVRTALWRKNP